MGKTRLLVEVAARMRPGADLGYLDLSGVGAPDVEEVAEAAARSLGVAVVPAGAASSLDGLVAALATREVLILIDEAEWAVESVATLAQALLGRCPGVAAVVTSRRPLEVTGERRVVVAPLACPPEDADGAGAAEYPAVRLLAERLADQAPDLNVSDGDVSRLAWIARRVDGLPLALELVAGHASAATLSELTALIDAPLDLPATDRDRTLRQRSLRETIQWSVDRLDPPARHVLRRLGVFAGPFTVAAARAVVGPVAGDAEALVRGLAKDALLQVDRDGTQVRLRMLRTVRDFAVEAAAGAGELPELRRRHRRWHAGRWRGAVLSDALIADVRAHYDDYVEALRSAMAARDAAAVTDLVITLTRSWLYDEVFTVGLRWCERALSCGLLDDLDRARVDVQLAAMLTAAGDRDARRVAERAAAAFPRDGYREWLSQALMVVALTHYQEGDFTVAARSARAAVAAAQQAEVTASGVTYYLAEALATLAACLVAAGASAEAAPLAEQAWSLVAEGDSLVAVAAVAHKVMLAFMEGGAAPRALEVADVAVRQLAEATTLPVPVTLRVNQAWAALACRLPDRALGGFAAALSTSQDPRLAWLLPEAGAGAGCAMAALEHPDAAAVLGLADALLDPGPFTLTPWQITQVEAARALLGQRGTAVGAALPHHRAQRLVDLVTRAAAGLPHAPSRG